MSLVNPLKKIALVTGANRGLGFEVALQLALRNFKVIMADKVNQTVSRKIIICESGNDDVYDYHLDLGSLYSVRCFTEKLHRDLNCIDVLVNNAAVFCMKQHKTEDCLDGVMQVNHLGPFLLTSSLTDLLKKSQSGRIVFVTSNGSFFHRLTVGQLSKPDYFTPHFISGAIHYYNTKLCNMISSKYFAENLREFNITCNCLHPHMMNTEFLTSNKEQNLLAKLEGSVATTLVKYLTRDVKYCADGVIHLADSKMVRNVTGKYFVNYQLHREPSVVEDKEFCRAICEKSKQLVGLKN